jgi:hypothetical protein
MDARPTGPAFAVAAGAFAVVCCAGLPAIGALIGGITIAGILGVAGGVLALAALVAGAALAVRACRRRGSCPPRARGRIR